MRFKINIPILIFLIQFLIISCIDENKTKPSYDSDGKQIITNEWIKHSKLTYGNDVKIELNRTFEDTVNVFKAKVYSANPELKLVNSPYSFDSKNTFKIDTLEGRIQDYHKFFKKNADTAFIFIRHSKKGKHTFDGVGLLFRNTNREFHFIDTIIDYEVLRR
jgi:hypothetical protein